MESKPWEMRISLRVLPRPSYDRQLTSRGGGVLFDHIFDALHFRGLGGSVPFGARGGDRGQGHRRLRHPHTRTYGGNGFGRGGQGRHVSGSACFWKQRACRDGATHLPLRGQSGAVRRSRCGIGHDGQGQVLVWSYRGWHENEAGGEHDDGHDDGCAGGGGRALRSSRPRQSATARGSRPGCDVEHAVQAEGACGAQSRPLQDSVPPQARPEGHALCSWPWRRFGAATSLGGSSQ
mmetsp:Transcript_26457/g.53133  ORF Transcript_26457/g.53133 Transcript_26457/m.53133 type:complete len:235 (-) Transcript_26457:528-1232(-)